MIFLNWKLEWNGYYKMKRFKTVKQYENQDCGPACISTLLKYYGVKKNPYLLRHDCGTDQSGSSILGIQNCLKKNKFNSAAYKIKITANNIDDIPKPFIQVEMGPHQMNHYIVVFAKEKDIVIIGDPKKGTLRVNVDELYNKEENNIIITVDIKEEFNEFHKRNLNIQPSDIIIDVLKNNKKDFIITNLLSFFLLSINLIHS